MKRLRYDVYSLLLALSLIASLVVPPGVANATSDYDGVIQRVDDLHLSRDGAVQGTPLCPSIDYTSSWMSVLTNAASWTPRTQYVGGTSYNDVMSAWSTALYNGSGWAVSQIEYGGASSPNDGDPIGDAIVVVFTPATTGEVQFSSEPIYFGAQKQAFLTTADDSNFYSVRIQFDDLGARGGDDQCSPVVSLAWRTPSSNPWSKELASVAATSTESAGGYSLRPLLVNIPVDYPSGYAGEEVPSEPLPAEYAALGDSYSGGDGNPQFEYGTDSDNLNECHRSPKAYPRLLQAELDLGPTAFVACAGATMANITGTGQWSEPLQLSALGDETEKVTLTVGGNDVGFRWYVLGCFAACGLGTSVYDAVMDAINDPAFKAGLVYTFGEILEAAPNANLYVADYPYLAAEDATTCLGLDFSGAYDVQEALNAVIGAAVAEVALSNNRIFMVRTNDSGSPFEGKHLCNGGASFFNGLVPWPNAEFSLHPNEDGQEAYADVFEEAMS